jgi:hypothetical protein
VATDGFYQMADVDAQSRLHGRFFLLGIDEDDRPASLLKAPRHYIDVLEPGIAVHMRASLPCLAIALQAEARGVEQPSHRARTDGMAQPARFSIRTRGALARPAYFAATPCVHFCAAQWSPAGALTNGTLYVSMNFAG